MQYSDEKPKNDDYKPKRDDYGYVGRERGGCLTLFLFVLTIGNLLAFVFFISQFSELAQLSERYGSSLGGEIASAQLLLAVIALVQVAAFVCVIGLWNWKQWGYNGLLVVYVISAVLNVLGGSFPAAIGSLIGAGILYYLVNERIEMFE